jgi:hypothetical protein
MEDQVRAVNEVPGCHAVILNAKNATAKLIGSIKRGTYTHVFLSPETALGGDKFELAKGANAKKKKKAKLPELIQALFRDDQFTKRVSALVVDEAHLIVDWADFRPEFEWVSIVRSFFADKPLMMLTATLTKSVRNNMLSALAVKLTEIHVEYTLPLRLDLTLYFWKKQEGDIDIVMKKLVESVRADEGRLLLCVRREDVMEKIWALGTEALAEADLVYREVVDEEPEPQTSRLESAIKAMSAGRHYVDPDKEYTQLQLELMKEMDLCGLGTFRSLGVSAPEIQRSSDLLRFKMFSSNTPREDEVKRSMLEDVSSADGNTSALACTIACGVGVNFRNCTGALVWEMPLTMNDFGQRIGRVGRGLVDPERRARIDAFWKGIEIKLNSAEDALRALCMDDEICRHLQLAKFFKWEAKYMGGRTVEAILSEAKTKIGLQPHDCCDVCARQCDCARDPDQRAARQNKNKCPVWSAVLKQMGRF